MGSRPFRDAGFADLGLKRALEDGLVEGPRVLISITLLGMTGGHADPSTPSRASSPLYGITYPGLPDPVCDGIDGVRRKVREVVREGADWIKMASSGAVLSPSSDPARPNFSQEEVGAIVQTAARPRAIGDVTRPRGGGDQTVRAGVRSIEHGTYLDEEAAAMMVERGTWLVPTLSAIRATAELAKDASLPEPMRSKAAEVSQHGLQAFALPVRAGVKIAMGTDCPVSPHGTNVRELLLMSQNGLTPQQALVAATSGAAKLLGLQDDLGTIEPGKRADS